MLTSFAPFRVVAGYMRNALIATWAPLYSPRQTSVNPPDATAMVPHFTSPVKTTAEVGSRSVALHTSPKAVRNFVLDESIVGYAFTRVVSWDLGDKSDLPDRPCPKIWSVPPVLVPECFAVVPCYQAKQ